MKHIVFYTLLISTFSACNPAKRCTERINPACICPQNFDPVCGCNGKTYSNACSAECAGIKNYTPGACGDVKTAASPENSNWKLKTIKASSNIRQVPENIEITLQLQNGKAEGRGGCNRYSSRFGRKELALEVAPVEVTEMFCAEPIGLMDQEVQYLSLLPQAAAYMLETGQLTLLDGAGNPLAIYITVQ